MTKKQIYSELAKIAGHLCYDGKKFIEAKRLGPDHLALVQRKMAALLQKLYYDRASADFGGIFERAYRDTCRQAPSPRRSPPETITATGVAWRPSLYTVRGLDAAVDNNE